MLGGRICHRAAWQCVLRGNQGRSGDSDAAFCHGLGSQGITVNAVAPGFVRTDMTLRGRGATDWQATEERFAARAMMGRVGEPQDVASAVVFLASPQSGWITAQTLTVAGGGWTTSDTVRIGRSFAASRSTSFE